MKYIIIIQNGHSLYVIYDYNREEERQNAKTTHHYKQAVWGLLNSGKVDKEWKYIKYNF